MLSSIFIEPITFSQTVIDWNQISVLNYFRAFSFLIGCSFLPGSCIYNILLKKFKLHKWFKVDPLLLKISLYPLISLTFLSLITLILDTFKLPRNYFELFLFLTIIILFLTDIIFNKYKNNEKIRLNIIKVKISKSTFLILIISVSVVFIALSTQLNVKYLIPGDSWRGIQYANYIGNPNTSPLDKFHIYSSYWGYFSFYLSILCGIPNININAMLFILLYLFVSSIFLLVKSILINFEEIYSILSTILIITFSGLLFFPNPILGYDKVSGLIFDGVFNFRHKSFAFISFIMGLALIIITLQRVKNKEFTLSNKNILIIFFASWFSIQSFMIYFFPLIPFILILTIYSFFSKDKIKCFKIYLKYLMFSIILFIFFDLITFFYFSWIISTFMSYFLLIAPPILNKFLILNGLLIYSIIIISLCGFLLIYKIYKRRFYLKYKKYYKFNIKLIFLIILGLISILLGIEIFFNIRATLKMNFFVFYFLLIFSNLGIIGILGIYLAYFSFKKDKELFQKLIIWSTLIIILASLFIYLQWIKFPFNNPYEIPENNYFNMVYWFSRLWFYSIIPFSILSSIGLLRLNQFFKPINKETNRFKSIKNITHLFFISSIIFFSMSNTVMGSVYWNNYSSFSDEDAQIMGWISENTPHDTNILLDRFILYHLEDNAFSNTFYIWDIIQNSLKNHTTQVSSFYKYDINCNIEDVSYFDYHENILNISDQSPEGYALIKVDFPSNENYGFIDFFFRISNKDKAFKIVLSNQLGEEVFLISVIESYFQVFNGSVYNRILEMQNDEWYKINIYYECTDNNYMGLDKFQVNIMINDTDLGKFNFSKNTDSINEISLFTFEKDFGYDVYLDKFNISSELSLIYENIEECILGKVKVIIEYLKSKNINYFIITKGDLFYYIYYKDLLRYFNNKMYEYRNYAIYLAS